MLSPVSCDKCGDKYVYHNLNPTQCTYKVSHKYVQFCVNLKNDLKMWCCLEILNLYETANVMNNSYMT